MEEPCFCTVEDIVKCLVDKTKISLPVIITACALGYIWAARKQMSDMKKQCTVLEDDMKSIKRENFKLCEEIRRLNYTASDTDLLTFAIKKCADKNRPKSGQCFRTEKTFLDKCARENRCISRKIKNKRSGITSPACSAKDLQLVSFSTPDVFNNSPLKLKPNCNKLHLPSFEWCPSAESTKIDKVMCNECDYGIEATDTIIGKPEPVTFYGPTCFEPKTKNRDFLNGSCGDKRSRRCSKNRSKIPDPIEPSFNCYSYDKKTRSKSPKNLFKKVCVSDLLICNSGLNEKKCCDQPSSKRNPFSQLQDENPFTNCDDIIKGCKPTKIVFQKANTYTPTNLSRCTRIKEKIDKCRNDITKDLNLLTNPFDCRYCRNSKHINDIIDLTGFCHNSNHHKHKSSCKKSKSRNISRCR